MQLDHSKEVLLDTASEYFLVFFKPYAFMVCRQTTLPSLQAGKMFQKKSLSVV
jgi:hypothetical protein